MVLLRVLSKQYYLRNKCLHGLPKFSSKAKVIQVGNGESVNILFIIPTIKAIQGHMFEIYTMVSEICDNMDLMLGFKKLCGVRRRNNYERTDF